MKNGGKMLSIISIICVIVGYLLFFFTELLAFPIILIFGGFLIALVDLGILYAKEKLQFSDLITEAFHSKLGNTLAFLAGIVFIVLLIIP